MKVKVATVPVTVAVPVSGLLEVEVVTEAGVLAMEHCVGRALSVGWRGRDTGSVGFGLLLSFLVVVEVVVEIMEEVMVEVNVADGWLRLGLALNLDFLPPDAEEDEASCEDDEEEAGGETEGEEAPAGGQPGGERNHSQSPLLAEVPLADHAGDIAVVVRPSQHCDGLRDGHQVGAGLLLYQDLQQSTVKTRLRATLSPGLISPECRCGDWPECRYSRQWWGEARPW